MFPRCQPLRTLLRCSLWIVLLAGCADGPFPELAALNPYLRARWKEDEKYGPTFYERVEQFEALRQQAGRMSPAQQEQLARDLVDGLPRTDNALLRREMVLTLGHLPTGASVEGLRAASADPDPDIRIAACQSWAKLGGPEAAEMLHTVLHREDNLDVRVAAAGELAKFPEAVSVNALATALDDPDPALQYRAMQSLKSVTGRDLGNDVRVWRDYVQSGSRAVPDAPSLVERMRNFF